MKAFVKDDIIVHITERGDTEIGKIPTEKRKVGLDRLRWDGTRIVDLMDCPEIWVVYNGYIFELHAIKVPFAHKVAMLYKDRNKLMVDGNTIRLKTAGEIQAEHQSKEAQKKATKLRRTLVQNVGDTNDQLADAYKLINLLIMVVIGKSKPAKDLLADMLIDIEQTYVVGEITEELKGKIKNRKNVLSNELP